MEKYTSPELEIIRFTHEDIIVTSTCTNPVPDGDAKNDELTPVT